MNPFTISTRWLRAGLLTAGTLTALSSCDPKEKEEPQPEGVITKSVYVVNEGTSKGAISLYSKEAKTVQRDAYQAANAGEQLGRFVQSMTIAGERAYVVVNGDGQLQVLNAGNLQKVATIRNLSQPRYFVAATADKGYVTEWQGAYPNYTAGRVSVIDLRTNTVTKTIPVGVNPEQVLLAGGKVYVANSYGTKISVINPTTDVVESEVDVPEGPKNLVLDGNGSIWAVCSKYGATQHFLVRFSPATPAQQTRISIPYSYGNGNLRTNAAGDNIYVSLGGAVYRLASTATTLPAAPFIRRDFYGLGIDPQDNTIYGGNAGNFTSDGRVIRYTANGAPIDSFSVAVAPNSFVFY